MLKRFKNLFGRPAPTPTSEDPLRDDILQDDFSQSAHAIDALAESVHLVAPRKQTGRAPGHSSLRWRLTCARGAPTWRSV